MNRRLFLTKAGLLVSATAASLIVEPIPVWKRKWWPVGINLKKAPPDVLRLSKIQFFSGRPGSLSSRLLAEIDVPSPWDGKSLTMVADRIMTVDHVEAVLTGNCEALGIKGQVSAPMHIDMQQRYLVPGQELMIERFEWSSNSKDVVRL